MKFYCKVHDAIICQECMLAEHIGIGHEIVSAEDMIKIDVLKNDAGRCVNKIEEHLTYLRECEDKIEMNYKSYRDDMV